MNQSPVQAKIDGDWMRCRICSHKLAKVIHRGSGGEPTIFEIKCHACKALNRIRGQIADLERLQ